MNLAGISVAIGVVAIAAAISPWLLVGLAAGAVVYLFVPSK